MFIKLVKSPRLEFRSMPLPVFLTTCLSSHLRLLMDNFLKKSLASFLYIPPGRIEIAGVPRIGYLAGTVGKVH